MPNFRTDFGRSIFESKYAAHKGETWPERCRVVVEDVCRDMLSKEDKDQLWEYMRDMKFIPGGRYLAKAGLPKKYFNNCYAFKCEEDTREEWARIMHDATLALMTGGGIGIDYSILRPSGYSLNGAGGVASGPIDLMRMVNEAGRYVMQGGTRRSAMWAGLSANHPDAVSVLSAKDWSSVIREQKALDFNFPAPLDMTNISLLWGDELDVDNPPKLWYDSVMKMCETGEPGHAYNFASQSRYTLRNACTEFITDSDSDMCNLGSLNLGNISTIEEFQSVVELGTKFLVCGSIVAALPGDKFYKVREEKRKIGLGLMGLHEWLLQRGYKYSVPPELHLWLDVYARNSESSALEHTSFLSCTPTVSYRAIAPTGTIGNLVGTTTGIEPIPYVAYKRRYMRDGRWHKEYLVDGVAQAMIDKYGVDPDSIETSYTLALDPERRIKVQYEIQKYVDMGISSTINLPSWGSSANNPDTARGLALLFAKYCHGLRGITVYPNGARAGQPIEEVDYEYAIKNKGVRYVESESACASGVCGS